MEPVALMTRHNRGSLAEAETLVRGSTRPSPDLQDELLRAVEQGGDTPPTQLLRAGQENRLVPGSGTLLILEGQLVGGKMVLEGQTTGSDGLVVHQRITWTPNPDGSVRQLWESTDAKGAWSIAFDGEYTRAKR